MAHLYLNEQLTDAAPGARVSIVGAEARHAVTVSRIRVGESLAIGNGVGLTVTGTVVEADAARLSILAEQIRRSPGPTPALVLVQALAKGGRDELAIQAATELGIDTVIPWSADRSVVRWQGERARKGSERWRSVVREASKQSLRAWVPSVGEPVTTNELARLAGSARMIVLDPAGEHRLTDLALAGEERDLVLVVGPEGGISPAERAALTGTGAILVRLGEHVLRTSTAGPAAVAAVNGALGRW
jgi:16S rRNA (uracil1498-N3)-methyltransferase